jgi:hypothetical protein
MLGTIFLHLIFEAFLLIFDGKFAHLAEIAGKSIEF